MDVLLLAPQPFYQERGTPIAVHLLVKALNDQGHYVDLLVFPEGKDKKYKNANIHRVSSPIKVSGVKPGFSLKKLYLDFCMVFSTISMLRKKKYDVVHAVEESALFCLLLKPFFKFKMVCDIDSSMTTQLIDKFSFLRFVEKPLRYIEDLPAKHAEAVVPMCDALADHIKEYRDSGIYVLKDIDLSDLEKEEESDAQQKAEVEDVRKYFDKPDDPLLMYIGNLESYQGIDLLLDSFAEAKKQDAQANLVIIGGELKDINKYQEKCNQLNIQDNAKLLGKRPVGALNAYMSQASYLVSPRLQGVNTPMKVFSYMGSGVPVLATRQSTHTQVMDDSTAILAEPTVDSFSAAIVNVSRAPDAYLSVAQKAQLFIQEQHSYVAFCETVESLYVYLGFLV